MALGSGKACPWLPAIRFTGIGPRQQVQVQVQDEGSATAAPLLCRFQVWTIPSRPPRATGRRANDES